MRMSDSDFRGFCRLFYRCFPSRDQMKTSAGSMAGLVRHVTTSLASRGAAVGCRRLFGSNLQSARDSGAWSLLSARRPAEAMGRHVSRGFSSKTVDIDSLDVKELRAMIGELEARLQAAEGRKEVGNTGDTPPVITGAPESMRRATKGEVQEENLKCITVVELQKMRDKGAPIAMATAYDYPSAVHVDTAGVDIVLVGDSVGMVVLGYDTTLPVTFDEILHHCKAVSRGCTRPLLVGDMPFGSYEVSTAEAQRNAYRLIKEGGMEAVKLEGCDSTRLQTCETLVRGGIAVMGHIGLTPQSYSTLGGFRAQGRHAKAAVNLIEQAKRLEGAGCFAMVVECVPDQVARALTEAVTIPVIGIGSGGHTSGQVLVYHDMLGMMQHPHHAKVTPKFCKQYSSAGVVINQGLSSYVSEVRSGVFPGEKYSPYKMATGELDLFLEELRLRTEAGAAHKAGKNAGADEPEIKVYG